MRAFTSLVAAACVCFGLDGVAAAQHSATGVRIAVMNDQSGQYNSATGPGAVIAARMATMDQTDARTYMSQCMVKARQRRGEQF